MERPRHKRYRFGPFEADIESGELFDSGKKVHLQAKPFALLAVLVEHHGEVVTRETLSKQLWPDTFVQADQGLNAAVRKVRRALRDDAEDPKYIETLGSRGYRFIHPLQTLDEPATLPGRAPSHPDVADRQNSAPGSETLGPTVEETPDDYLCGKYFLSLRTTAGLRKALEYFNAATARDPGFALAYCGLADTHLSEGMSELTLPRTAWELARSAAVKALRLDANLADAYLPLAMTQLCLEHDWRGATASLEKAKALNPNLPYIYFWYSFILATRGENSGSLEMALRAKRLDPLSLPINTAVSFSAYFAGDFGRAVATANHILELNDRFPFAYETLGLVAEAEGKWDEAIRHYERAAALSGRWPTILGYLGYAHAATGNLAAAHELLRELHEVPNYTPNFEVAAIQLGLGDVEGCLTSLTRAHVDRSPRILLLNGDYRFQQLQSNPGFVNLMSQIFPGIEITP